MPVFSLTAFWQFTVDYLGEHPTVYLLVLLCGIYLAYRCVRVVRDEQRREYDELERARAARFKAQQQLFEAIRSNRGNVPPAA